MSEIRALLVGNIVGLSLVHIVENRSVYSPFQGMRSIERENISNKLFVF